MLHRNPSRRQGSIDKAGRATRAQESQIYAARHFAVKVAKLSEGLVATESNNHKPFKAGKS
jgi:hypothetical protein